MKEEYLHLLWKLKRIPATQLTLSDGRPVELLSFGWYNTASGPDFFNGKIKIDGITWSGNIEMHIKSSDWYLHQHQTDPAYDNVILHVVYDHNREVFVKNEKLPVLELKNYIDWEHYKKYMDLRLSASWIACGSSLKDITTITISQQKELSLINRLERKAPQLENDLNNLKGDYLQLLYEQYAKVFGLKINEIPFLELSKKLPFKLIRHKSKEELTTLMMGVSGLLDPQNQQQKVVFNEWSYFKRKYSLSELNPHCWKRKGLRPISFPEVKVKEFAVFCSQTENFVLDSAVELAVKMHPQSKNLSLLLQLNVQSLWLWWKGKRLNDFSLQEKAVSLLESLDAEQNSIIKKWNQHGIVAKNAYDSQALLELKNEYCRQKKCLQCKIGIETLKGTP